MKNVICLQLKISNSPTDFKMDSQLTNNNCLLTEQARLVSCLLYGTLFLIVKCNGTLFLIVKCNFKNALQQNLTKAVVDSKTRERVSCRSNNFFLVAKYGSSQCQVKL